ncbi:acyltransferase [Tianweitania sediminis]|uniref:Acyltransferase n=1 Tax=Tianweitania sediminis TaxID=1502156 RepID=A0A8J7R9K7_9HYPH|nr:hypothetical protein [Tianweitania sediminis]MBP0441370.1 hypothetical protein [Tianweitania sediminis]
MTDQNSIAAGRLPPNLPEWISTSAQGLWSQIGIAKPDPSFSYILAQVLNSYTDGEVNCRIEPLSEYREVRDGDIEGLKIENPSAKVFIAAGASFKRTRVSGSKPGCVYIGTDALLIDTNIALLAETNTVCFGFNCRTEGLLIHMYGKAGFVILGSGTTVQQGSNFLVQEGSYILTGSDCMVSTAVYIRTSDSHTIIDKATRKRINPPRPVILHPRVWLSRAVLVNKGTEIGEETVVGQGAVTSGQLLPSRIYAGSPAVAVKEGVTWDRRAISELDEGHDFSSGHFTPSFSKNLARARSLPQGDLEKISFEIASPTSASTAASYHLYPEVSALLQYVATCKSDRARFSVPHAENHFLKSKLVHSET